MIKIAKQATTTTTTTDRVAWWADRLSILGFFEVTPREVLGVLVLLGVGSYSTQLPWYRSLFSGPPPAPISGPPAASPPSLNSGEAGQRAGTDRVNALRLADNDQIRESCRERVIGQMRWKIDPAQLQSSAINRARDNCEQEMRLRHVERNQS
jgi:hypothetical protein